MDRPIVSILFLTLLFTYIASYQGSELMVKSVENSSLDFTPCSNDTDCETFTNGICVDQLCECNGTKFCDDGTTGTKVTKLGEICKIKADCNIEHSVCEQNKCTCEDGRVGSMDGRRCLKDSDEPCIGSVCNGSISEDQSTKCVTGTCLCPEERPYCTNQADSENVRRTVPRAQPRGKEQVAKKKSQIPERGRFVQTLYGGPLEDESLIDIIYPDEKTDLYVTSWSNITMYALLALSLGVIMFTPNYVRTYFAKHLIPVFAYVFINCALWVSSYRELMITFNAVVFLSVSSVFLLYITYKMIRSIIEQDSLADTRQTEDELEQPIAYPVAPFARRRHHPHRR